MDAAKTVTATFNMAGVYTDNFNRGTGSDLGSSWIEKEDSAHWGLATDLYNNQARTYKLHGGFAYWNDVWQNDQYSSLQYTGRDTNNDTGGPAVRIDPAGDWNNATLYAAEYEKFGTNPGVGRLRKYINQSLWSNSGTVLGSYSIDINVGQWLKIQAQGSTIKVLIDGVERISVTDTSIGSGKAGMAVHDDPSLSAAGALYWDNWEGGAP